jgi:hypothetical protein
VLIVDTPGGATGLHSHVAACARRTYADALARNGYSAAATRAPLDVSGCSLTTSSRTVPIAGRFLVIACNAA